MPLASANFTFSYEKEVLARFTLRPGTYVIGCDDSCEVVIALEGMQPHHARLVVGEAVQVEDLGSGAPTLLAGRPFGQLTELPVNQPVSFGACLGLLTLDAPVLVEKPPSRASEETPPAVKPEALPPAAENEVAAEIPPLLLDEPIAAFVEDRPGPEPEASQAPAAEPPPSPALPDPEPDLPPFDKAVADKTGQVPETPTLPATAPSPSLSHTEPGLQNGRSPESQLPTAPNPPAELIAEISGVTAPTSEPLVVAPAMPAVSPPAVAPAAAPEGRATAEIPPERTAAGAAQRRRRKPRLTFPKETAPSANQYPDSSPGWAVWDREEAVSKRPPTLAELQERLASQEGELAALKGNLAQAESLVLQLTETDRTEREKAKEKAGLLSIANRALLKKLSKAAAPIEETAVLRKELQQREAALVEAWSRRQAADERCAHLGKQIARLEEGRAEPAPSPLVNLPAWLGWSLLASVLALGVLGFTFKGTWQRARRAEYVVGKLRATAPQFMAEAKTYVANGEFQPALAKIESALALDAGRAEYLVLKGNLYESLLLLDPAMEAYEDALDSAPANTAARKNLELCRSLKATRRGALSPESQYALHAQMMEEGRLPEAMQMARRLGNDRPLLFRTWSAILEDAGLKAHFELNADGTFDLDLTSQSKVDLTLLRGLPLRKLGLAKSNVSDLTPLRDAKIRELDLAGNPVRDLTALSGMPLEKLNLANTEVSNLFPLAGIVGLRELVLDFAPVTDLTPLRGMHLQVLRAAGTTVWNLQALAESPLRLLDLDRTRVSDLGPLQHLPLEELHVSGTSVSGLLPLAGAPLRVLTAARTGVETLEPLQKCPLRVLDLGGCPKLRSVQPLAVCLELERLILPPQVKDLNALKGLPQLRFLAYDAEGTNTPAVMEKTAQTFWRELAGK